LCALAPGRMAGGRQLPGGGRGCAGVDACLRRFDLLEEAVQRAGPGKILFGSDGPWLHPGVELEKILALGLPPAEEDLILGGNFLRLINKQENHAFGLKPRLKTAPGRPAVFAEPGG
ncbi:MAG: amidohydrolase family protein, partial [Rubrivivax sp.]|nr:amidohydrolase family protein [Rubrivivax sp.]